MIWTITISGDALAYTIGQGEKTARRAAMVASVWGKPGEIIQVSSDSLRSPVKYQITPTGLIRVKK